MVGAEIIGEFRCSATSMRFFDGLISIKWFPVYQEGKGLQQYHGKPSFNQKPESMVEKYWELIVAEKETIEASGKVKTHMIVSIL